MRSADARRRAVGGVVVTRTAVAHRGSEQADVVEFSSRRGRYRLAIVAAVLIFIATGAFLAVGDVLHGEGASRWPDSSGPAISLATVRLGSLSQQMQVNGTLGFADSYTVLGHATGTVTWLPALGQVITEGHALYRVDGAPVVLLYGSTPAFRTIAEGVTGTEVAQLNHDLVALGYVTTADVNSAWDEFNWATLAGVEELQKHLGVEQTGQLSLGAVVFLPTAARVTTVTAIAGGPATGPVLTASSTARVVSVALDADLQSEVKVGDQVTITLPDNSTTPGTVASVGKVATIPPTNTGNGGSSTPTVPVTIRPTDPEATGRLDQAPVVVSITDHTVRNALSVPVAALLAMSGGRYAVEVVDGAGSHHMVRVTPGLFDDAAGLVQVSGSGLAAGQRVVTGQ